MKSKQPDTDEQKQSQNWTSSKLALSPSGLKETASALDIHKKKIKDQEKVAQKLAENTTFDPNETIQLENEKFNK